MQHRSLHRVELRLYGKPYEGQGRKKHPAHQLKRGPGNPGLGFEGVAFPLKEVLQKLLFFPVYHAPTSCCLLSNPYQIKCPLEPFLNKRRLRWEGSFALVPRGGTVCIIQSGGSLFLKFQNILQQHRIFCAWCERQHLTVLHRVQKVPPCVVLPPKP